MNIVERSREKMITLLKCSQTRCAFIRELIEKGAALRVEDALKIQNIDDALYKLCLDIPYNNEVNHG